MTGLKWPEILSIVLWHTRQTPRMPLGLSPFEILFGRPALVPGTYIPAHASLLDGDETLARYVARLQKELTDNQSEAQLFQTVPLGLQVYSFKPGDWVLVKKIPHTNPLEPWWDGPYQVLLCTYSASKVAGKRWEGNSFLNLTRTTIQSVNRTQCWICIHTPTHIGQGVPVVGVPIPLNRTLQAELWMNTMFTWNATIQTWCIHMRSGWYWLCNYTVYKTLLAGWCGMCTLGAIVPAVTVHQTLTQGEIRNLVRRNRQSVPLNPRSDWPTSFHSFVCWFLPWLGVSELEKAIGNISAVLEVMANATADAFFMQSHLTLDYLLATQGGVCALVNSSSCVFLKQHGQVETDNHAIMQQAASFHCISLDDTSTGFQEVWNWLTSWLQDLWAWGRRILYLILFVVFFFVFIFVCLQCCSICSRQLLIFHRGYSAPI
uniref:Murine leukemia virus integrase C-terminal domain-containing protein n=1 Tax=Chelonoidis abingdonii TaxID=106734 RepID=A0A8C0J5V4_CHEAB